ncbi:hypothetical protein [Streptosporangium sp. OZ121]
MPTVFVHGFPETPEVREPPLVELGHRWMTRDPGRGARVLTGFRDSPDR